MRPTFLPRRLIQIDARYDAVLAEGFPVVLGGNDESLQLARDVDRIAAELGLFPKIYIEVNLAAESSKHGFTAEQLRTNLEALYSLKRLEIQGLMCIPPFDLTPEQSRKYFVQLRTLRDELVKLGGAALPVLSMGMSHDFEIAIEEGATLVRVGSAIFGDRHYP